MSSKDWDYKTPQPEKEITEAMVQDALAEELSPSVLQDKKFHFSLFSKNFGILYENLPLVIARIDVLIKQHPDKLVLIKNLAKILDELEEGLKAREIAFSLLKRGQQTQILTALYIINACSDYNLYRGEKVPKLESKEVEQIFPLLKNKSAEIRRAAAQALGLWYDGDISIEFLEILSSEPVAENTTCLAYWIGERKSLADAVPVLANTIHSTTNRDVQKKFLQALVSLAASEKEEVRDSALNALSKILAGEAAIAKIKNIFDGTDTLSGPSWFISRVCEVADSQLLSFLNVLYHSDLEQSSRYKALEAMCKIDREQAQRILFQAITIDSERLSATPVILCNLLDAADDNAIIDKLIDTLGSEIFDSSSLLNNFFRLCEKEKLSSLVLEYLENRSSDTWSLCPLQAIAWHLDEKVSVEQMVKELIAGDVIEKYPVEDLLKDLDDYPGRTSGNHFSPNGLILDVLTIRNEMCSFPYDDLDYPPRYDELIWLIAKDSKGAFEVSEVRQISSRKNKELIEVEFVSYGKTYFFSAVERYKCYDRRPLINTLNKALEESGSEKSFFNLNNDSADLVAYFICAPRVFFEEFVRKFYLVLDDRGDSYRAELAQNLELSIRELLEGES